MQSSLLIQEPTLVESSGLAFSKLYSDRLYHVNDSGSKPEFFISKADGTDVIKIPVHQRYVIDTEDLAVGPCLDENSCLVIGDIGDNYRLRLAVQFTVFKESALEINRLRQIVANKMQVVPDLTLLIRYPDGAHNAEAFYINVEGELTVITKEKEGGIASIYTYPLKNIRKPLASRLPINWPKFKFEGKLNLKSWLPWKYKGHNTEITSVDFNPETQTVAILTYDGIFETNISTRGLPTETGRKYWPLKIDNQQEAIAYQPGTNDLWLTSESKNAFAPLTPFTCDN